jgi:CRISPR-associated protein Cmr6
MASKKSKSSKAPQSLKDQLVQLTGPKISPVKSLNNEIHQVPNPSKIRNPLQTLNCIDFSKELDTKFSDTQSEEQKLLFLLEETAKADNKTCQPIYDILNQRTESLSTESFEVYFPARLRVSGIQGFRERLLPALHTVYGVPYVPASSIKGIVKAWAEHHQPEGLETVQRLFGFLNQAASEDEQKASLGTVQILDAFPTTPCLSIDVATPQWNWKGNRVEYGPSPHYMMSLQNVTLKIGLVKTSLGSETDVKLARRWLEQALIQEGLGSRISAGYGRVIQPQASTSETDSQAPEISKLVESRWRTSSHSFELWSQGIYSVSDQIELRSVAIRGVLRYWFRAVALSFCSPLNCQKFEAALFGSIDTTLNKDKKPTHGSVKISVDVEEGSKLNNQGSHTPYYAKGTIHLESTNRGHLTLIKYILRIAMHLGGIGRGARRPLHCNSGRLRGCYWQATDYKDILGYDLDEWMTMLKNLRDVCQGLCNQLLLVSNPEACSPGDTLHRYQDVLNQNARIYLVKADNTRHPQDVPHNQWKQQGKHLEVLGPALDFWYKSGFKGGTGNTSVGGDLGTPSFVWIQSNNLHDSNNAYQAITLFGVDHPKREDFLRTIQSSNQIQEKIEITLPWA